MAARRPVVAVIPHYNMPKTLAPLLGQVLDQGYDGVYVLDDHSTNCTIQDVLKPFGSAVTLVAGDKNRGAGGNRNRILEVDPEKLKGTILHFIDADCELMSDGIPATARRLFEDPGIGAVGGLVLNTDGTQYAWNYGPHMSWLFGLSANLQGVMVAMARRSPAKSRRMRQVFKNILAGWPDIHTAPISQEVFGLTEANFLIPYDTFLAIGGFDKDLRYYEAQNLAYKLQARNLRRRFEPTIVVKHYAVQVRGKARTLKGMPSVYRIARKHGLPFK